ncbi:MAG: hypothetical protein MJ252_23995 [archaeon]|nr:hypothetical protein [archaeon]
MAPKKKNKNKKKGQTVAVEIDSTPQQGSEAPVTTSLKVNTTSEAVEQRPIEVKVETTESSGKEEAKALLGVLGPKTESNDISIKIRQTEEEVPKEDEKNKEAAKNLMGVLKAGEKKEEDDEGFVTVTSKGKKSKKVEEDEEEPEKETNDSKAAKNLMGVLRAGKTQKKEEEPEEESRDVSIKFKIDKKKETEEEELPNEEDETGKEAAHNLVGVLRSARNKNKEANPDSDEDYAHVEYDEFGNKIEIPTNKNEDEEEIPKKTRDLSERPIDEDLYKEGKYGITGLDEGSLPPMDVLNKRQKEIKIIKKKEESDEDEDEPIYDEFGKTIKNVSKPKEEEIPKKESKDAVAAKNLLGVLNKNKKKEEPKNAKKKEESDEDEAEPIYDEYGKTIKIDKKKEKEVPKKEEEEGVPKKESKDAVAAKNLIGVLNMGKKKKGEPKKETVEEEFPSGERVNTENPRSLRNKPTQPDLAEEDYKQRMNTETYRGYDEKKFTPLNERMMRIICKRKEDDDLVYLLEVGPRCNLICLESLPEDEKERETTTEYFDLEK